FQHHEMLNIIFAAAPSQNEFLENLILKPIKWDRINAFHMDEYLGLPSDAPQGFGNFLSKALFDKVNFRSVNFLNGNPLTPEQECERYTQLIAHNHPDIVCMGIGENTHIAFNDPHVANFEDPEKVKMVNLDEPCRQQQVNDGCFASINEVPAYALTLTIPALMAADHIFCMVPGAQKAKAIQHTLNAPISATFPSTILRQHPSAILYVDEQSGLSVG
ncbi:MAG: glucosamine-6-phosphate deaminase, partial [Chitinophagaceae bacterium]